MHFFLYKIDDEPRKLNMMSLKLELATFIWFVAHTEDLEVCRNVYIASKKNSLTYIRILNAIIVS